MNCRPFTLVVIVAGLTGIVAAQGGAPDWPQWRGPNRDGSVASFTAPKVWPERLNQRWKVDVGLGHATPLVVANRVYVFSRRGNDEVMAALDADSGKLLWQTGYPVQFTMDKSAAPHGPGPKSTPAFADGKLYAIGMTGIVSAFDAAAGKLLWQTPAPGNMLLWTSNSFSPLVDRGLVVVHVGGNDKGALTAFAAATGDVKWIWRDDGPGYGSPIVADLAGTRQIVTMTQKKFIGVDAATGALLWEQPYITEYAQNIITPVQYGQTLVVSGYQKPVTAFAVTKLKDRWAIQTLWENPDVSMYMSDAVLAGETIIGFSQRRSGQFFGLDPQTGKTLWMSDPRQAENAAIVAAGTLWFALKDDGELIVARGSRTAFDPLRRYAVANSPTWAQPVISGSRVFVKDLSTLTLWTLN